MNHQYLPSENPKTIVIQTDRPSKEYFKGIPGVVQVITLGANIYSIDLADYAKYSDVLRQIELTVSQIP